MHWLKDTGVKSWHVSIDIFRLVWRQMMRTGLWPRNYTTSHPLTTFLTFGYAVSLSPLPQRQDGCPLRILVDAKVVVQTLLSHIHHCTHLSSLPPMAQEVITGVKMKSSSTRSSRQSWSTLSWLYTTLDGSSLACSSTPSSVRLSVKWQTHSILQERISCMKTTLWMAIKHQKWQTPKFRLPTLKWKMEIITTQIMLSRPVVQSVKLTSEKQEVIRIPL